MILCPLCGAKTRVLETRVTATAGGARRRRGCTAGECAGKVTTIEVVVPDGRALDLIVELQKLVAAIEGDAL